MRQALEVRNLIVTAGGRAVLHDLSFAVPAGRVTGVLGPTRSGKSTLLRCVVGAQQLGSGEVEVLGTRAGAASLRRRVGYLTETDSVYPDLSVRRNVRYFAALHGMSRVAADHALADVEMSDHGRRLVGSLADDERARVSLACALVAAPELLVLDEPTAGLDPVPRAALWAYLRSLAARGTTLLVASQALDEAGRCDQLLLLREGRLIADDTPGGLLSSTGAADAETAFVRLCERGGSPPSAAPASLLLEAAR